MVYFKALWDWISDNHPIAALLLFIVSPLLVAPLILFPLYYVFKNLLRVSGNADKFKGYVLDFKSDFLIYYGFVLSKWEFILAYCLICVGIYLFFPDNILLRDASIILSAAIFMIGFLISGKKTMQVRSFSNITIMYLIFLMVAVTPFLTEFESTGGRFNKWYSYIFVLSPVSSAALLIARVK